MFFPAFPSFSATKSAARASTRERSQPKAAHATHTATTPPKKPSRLQTVLRALRLSRPQPRVISVEEQHRQPQVNHTLPVASEVGGDARPNYPATHQDPALSTSAWPSAASTPSYFPDSTFSTTLPQSAATTPATIYSNPPAAPAFNTPPLATDPAAATRRIADLDFAISRLEQDGVRQTSETHTLLNETFSPRIVAFTEERDVEKAARAFAEDRLAEEIARHAKTEKLLLKERKRHRKEESTRIKACYALEQENANLEADLLDLTARADLLHVQALQKALVQLRIVDANHRQYPLKYPVCGDCMGPFLKAVCTAAKQDTRSSSKGEPEHELATAAYQTFEAPGDEDSCSEQVSDRRARAPAPTEWFKSGSTRTRRPA